MYISIMAINKTFTQKKKKNYGDSYMLAIYKINKIISRCVYHMYRAKYSAHSARISSNSSCEYELLVPIYKTQKLE